MLKKELALRIYQEELLNTATKHNTMVVLPTGLGKTMIALALSIFELKKNPQGIVIFTAPTKPLVEQHKKLFEEYLNTEMMIATGKTPPKERIELYKSAKIIFCTPQTMENDILTGRIDLTNACLMIFDEAHRASEGDYSYNFLAEQYVRLSKHGRVLALSASPGHSKEQVKAICKNLRIDRIEVKGEHDESVKPYVQEKKVIPIVVELPKSFLEVKKHLEKAQDSLIRRLFELQLIDKKNAVYKKDLLKIQAQLQGVVARGEASRETFEAIKFAAAAHKVNHALELIQMQGAKALKNYFSKLHKQSGNTKSSKLLFDIADFTFAYTKIFDSEDEHPKYEKLKELVSKEDLKKSRIIIFTRLRETAREITELLNGIKNVNAQVFVGQKEGMTQKKQLETLEKFKHGEYNVLASTTIGEEGIHVSDADVGIFFEPVSSALRSIQRKGRVGRTSLGRVYVLMTKDCIDERYYWISKNREKKMVKELEELKGEDLNQFSLTDFIA